MVWKSSVAEGGSVTTGFSNIQSGAVHAGVVKLPNLRFIIMISRPSGVPPSFTSAASSCIGVKVWRLAMNLFVKITSNPFNPPISKVVEPPKVKVPAGRKPN